MERLILERVYLKDRTLGSLYRNGELICKVLELPWKDNKRAISCIPEGIYRTIKQPPKESRPYKYFRLPNVPGRSGILIHRGTNPLHSKGCLLVGGRFKDIDTDFPTLGESADKLTWMTENLPEEFELLITKKPAVV
jgi:hypothetical protein